MSGRSSLEEVLYFLLIKGWIWISRTIEMTFLLVHCCPGHESTSKNDPGLFRRTLHHHMELKDSGVAFRECSALHYHWGMGPSSPDLNPLDFRIWSYLESKVSTLHHQSLEALKVKLRKEWAKILQKVIRDSCKAFSKRLQLVIDADGGHIELYFKILMTLCFTCKHSNHAESFRYVKIYHKNNGK